MKFDGRDGCTIHSMANKAGLRAGVEQNTDQCTYQVYKDGTGKIMAFLGGPNNQYTFNAFFVLVKEGQELMFTRLEGTDNPADAAALRWPLASRRNSRPFDRRRDGHAIRRVHHLWYCLHKVRRMQPIFRRVACA